MSDNDWADTEWPKKELFVSYWAKHHDDVLGRVGTAAGILKFEKRWRWVDFSSSDRFIFGDRQPNTHLIRKREGGGQGLFGNSDREGKNHPPYGDIN